MELGSWALGRERILGYWVGPMSSHESLKVGTLSQPSQTGEERRNSKPGRNLTRIWWWRKGNMREEWGWSLEAGPALSLQPANDRDLSPTTAKSWILPTTQWARKRPPLEPAERNTAQGRTPWLLTEDLQTYKKVTAGTEKEYPGIKLRATYCTLLMGQKLLKCFGKPFGKPYLLRLNIYAQSTS